MNRILISGYIGFNNFGDEALLHVLIKDLLGVGFKIEDITVISNSPIETANKFGVNAISRWNIFSLVNALIFNSSLIFVGGLFQDKTSFLSMLYYSLQLFFASMLQKNIVFYGAGIGPLQRKSSQFLFNFLITNIKYITVRDQISANYIPSGTHVAVTCDPVWAMEPDFSFKKRITNVNWNLPIIGISMRHDKYLQNHHITNIVDKVSKVLNGRKDWQVLLLPCMPQEDLHILYEMQESISRKIGTSDRVFLIENFNQFDIPQQAGILASCNAMIGMRYHALLLPLLNGQAVFGLIYDQKIKSLLEFASQVSVSFYDSFEQPWDYFWQNLQHSTNMAKNAAIKAKQLHKVNIEMLETLFNS